MSTWVLLRGLAREQRHWGAFPQVLMSHLPPGSTVLTLDLPGNGERHREKSPASIPAMVDAYRAQLGAMPVRKPVVLLGLSMGGMVAAEWASRFSGELSGCVLVNSSAGGLSWPWSRLRPRAWFYMAGTLLPGRSAYAREAALLRLCSEAPVEAVAVQWASYALQCRTSGINALRQLWAAAHWRLPHIAPRIPVLVIASRHDRLVSCDASAAIAAHWQAPLVSHPDAGHELSVDAPAWLARHCASFAMSPIMHG